MMKTVKFRRLTVAGMVAVGMLLGNPVAAESGKDGLSNPGNNSLTETKEHKSIEKRLRTIETLHMRKDWLQTCIKLEKAAKEDVAVANDQEQLKRTKADIKRDMAYLKTDKKTLLQNRKTEIRKVRSEKRDCRYAILEARYLLKKDMRKMNNEALKYDAERVASLNMELQAIREKERLLRSERNDYVLYINDQIQQAGAPGQPLISSENTWARLDNFLMS